MTCSLFTLWTGSRCSDAENIGGDCVFDVVFTLWSVNRGR